jgi:hypothetical protein
LDLIGEGLRIQLRHCPSLPFNRRSYHSSTPTWPKHRFASSQILCIVAVWHDLFELLLGIVPSLWSSTSAF